MNAGQTLIDDLEGAVASKEIGVRADMLRRITDLFESGASQLSPDQIALFDSVMGRLIDEVEQSARVALGQRLAACVVPPPRVVRKLALDDSIQVAGTVLSDCKALDEETLVIGARTKSQDHLLAISRRQTISEAITDILVDRGNNAVAISTTANPGARFSEHGYSTLVERSEYDGDLAHRIWARSDVPRQHLLHLFSLASERVQRELTAAEPQKAALIETMVVKATDKLQAVAREQSQDYQAAFSRIQSLYNSNDLQEAKLLNFAVDGKFDETLIALSLMSKMRVDVVERAMVHGNDDHILILAKSIGLSWESARAILLLATGVKGNAAQQVESCRARYDRLQSSTARKVVGFLRLKVRASLPGNLRTT